MAPAHMTRFLSERPENPGNSLIRPVDRDLLGSNLTYEELVSSGGARPPEEDLHDFLSSYFLPRA